MRFRQLIFIFLTAIAAVGCGTDSTGLAQQNVDRGEIGSRTDPPPTVAEPVAAETAAPSTNDVAAPANNTETVVEVWTITGDVPMGLPFMDAYNDGLVERSEVDSAGVEGQLVDDLATLQGFIAARDITPGSTLTEGLFYDLFAAEPTHVTLYTTRTPIKFGTSLQAAVDDRSFDFTVVPVSDPLAEGAITDVRAEIERSHTKATLDIPVGTVLVPGLFEEMSPSTALEAAWLMMQDITLPKTDTQFSDAYVTFDWDGFSEDTSKEVGERTITPELGVLGFREVERRQLTITMIYGTCAYVDVTATGPKTLDVFFRDEC